MNEEKYQITIGVLGFLLFVSVLLWFNAMQSASDYRNAFNEANDVIANTHYQIEEAQSGKDGASYSELHDRLDSIEIPEEVIKPD